MVTYSSDTCTCVNILSINNAFFTELFLCDVNTKLSKLLLLMRVRVNSTSVTSVENAVDVGVVYAEFKLFVHNIVHSCWKSLDELTFARGFLWFLTLFFTMDLRNVDFASSSAICAKICFSIRRM